MTTIRDEDFSTPAEINIQPCLTASRFLNTVSESVVITQICQDTYNTSLVVIDFILVGAFLFYPTLKIISVDGDGSYASNNVVAPLAVGHYKNPTIPINTNCTTYQGQLVFDVGSVINNYITAQTIELSLEMRGEVPQSFGVSFPNQTVTSDFSWNKGILPHPINLTYNGGMLGVTFEYRGDRDCSCNIQCLIPSGVAQNIAFCPGQQQTVYLYRDPSSLDPYSLLIQLQDSLGNVSQISTQSLIGVSPAAPIVSAHTKPKHVKINLIRSSVNGVEINNTNSYKILKYQGSVNNRHTWKDWSNLNWNNFIDYDVIPGERYGYAVKFKGELGDESNISSWIEIQL